MLRLLLKSGSFVLLAACAVCAQQAAPAVQPTSQRPPRRIMLPPDAQRGTADNVQAVPAKEQTIQAAPKAAPAQPAAGATKTTTTHAATTTSKTRVTNKKTGKRGKPVVEETPVAVAPPPPPPTPEQMPATPPQVSYRGGLLSINSQNSTLGDILNAVRKLTGGTVEAPGTTLSERVATRLGPASPKDVLANLFSGSRFDYIILGSTNNPNGIDRIILTPRQNGSIASAAGPARTPVNGAARPAEPPPDAEAESDEDTSPDREVVEEPAPNEQPEQQEQPEEKPAPYNQPVPNGQGQQFPNTPGQQNPNAQGQQNQTPDQQNPNATDQENQQNPQNPQQPKSPEQLLKELQDMQRQRQSSPSDQQENPR